MGRMVRDDANGRIYWLDTLFMKHLTAPEAAALSAAGYTYTSFPTVTLQGLASAHGVPVASIPANNGTYSVANAVPTTVQGASEQFILDGLGKVVANTNTAANMLSVGIGQSEARVIARINATHGA